MQEFIENFHGILEDTQISELNQQTNFKNLNEWDSMMALMLIAMVDEKYNKQINGTDIKESKTLEDLYNLIKSK
jgi:acyl carrier protein